MVWSFIVFRRGVPSKWGKPEKGVDQLQNFHIICKKSRPFVDKIRLLGNDGTHKLENRTEEDAKLALKFTGILLKNIYEMPKILENS